jgi:uncharacterized membrane protein
MLVIGIVVFIVVTLLPGLLAVRLLRKELHTLDTVLYATGLGLLFNILVGAIANFTYGIGLLSVAVVYASLIVPLGAFSYAFGRRLPLQWHGWKPIVIPAGLYLLALGLQLQTTLMSPNLVGSDIHLEYFVSNMVLEQGSWNPMYAGTTLNACLGLTLLFPVYKLMTGLTLMWVFKLVAPLIFAVLPVVLYRIFRMQFGTLVSVLAVVFFVTMPMFTMDMVQLARQQQAMLFFVLVVLVVMDGNLSVLRKMVLGVAFSIGAMVTHIGMAIGFTGYLLAGAVIAVLLARWWRNKVDDAKKPILSRLVVAGLALASIGIYAGFYGWVYNGTMITSATIPATIVGNTVQQAGAGTIADVVREPLAQTAIGLDFGKASALGKVWRVLQYLVEICLVVGFFRLLLRPLRSLKIEYMAFVVASFFVLAGIYLLSSYGWGLGTPRVWGITLLFISPLFVLGAEAIGKWLLRLRQTKSKLLLGSTLVLLVPYFVFNSGIVFEVAKLEPIGFIDVPYSIPLSAHRVDIASVFTDEDVEAMDWLKAQFLEDGLTIYADTHGANLMVQRIGMNVKEGQFKYLWQMADSDTGYIFLREWNVDNNKLTLYRDYGTRQSYSIDDYEVVRGKIGNGAVVFDNGAGVILVTK